VGYVRGVPTETLVGSTLAGYTLRAKVGEGGTSTVFRADHPQHGTVALKVLREKLRMDKTAVARFLREAQFGTRVEHPNIVRTIEFGQDDAQRYFLAIEWVNGQILDKYAEKAGPLPCAEVASILAQICSAVQAAHDAGIVHRDLKPENVMYDPESHHVKLLDFGIASDTDATPDQRLTRAGFFVGTLMYVAPEALSGELVGPAADQYSLATIAYYLLTGALPYSGKSPRELFSQLLTQPPTPIGSVRPNLKIPGSVANVVMKALSKQPAERYPSVQAFSDALTAASTPEAIAAGGTAPTQPAPAPSAPPKASAGPSAPAPTAATTEPNEEKSGLFGKMKGLFRRG
jgi:serine/threonine-protein kinase